MVPSGIVANIYDCAWHAERARRLSAILLCSIVRLRALHTYYDDDTHEMRYYNWLSIGQGHQLGLRVLS